MKIKLLFILALLLVGCTENERSVASHNQIVKKNAHNFSTLLSKFSELSSHQRHFIANFGHSTSQKWTSTGLIGRTIKATLEFPVEVDFNTRLVTKSGEAQLRLYDVEDAVLLKNGQYALSYSDAQPVLTESEFFNETSSSIEAMFEERDVESFKIIMSFRGVEL